MRLEVAVHVFGDDHLAAHGHEVAGEGADEFELAFLVRGCELQALGIAPQK